MTFDQSLLVAAALIGFGAGFAARRARFCTFGAIEDVVMIGDVTRLRAWVLAIGVAILGVQLMWWTDTADIGAAFYLSSAFNPVGLFVGGLMFGIGMAMVGNCAFGMLIRLGGGDLRALFVFLVMGLSAYATARGLAAVVRVTLFDGFEMDLSTIGGQGAGHLIGALMGTAPAQASMAAGLSIALLIFAWCLRDGAFRAAHKDWLAGIAVGLAVTAGFWVTGGWSREGFAPLDVRSLTYVLPPGESIVYVLTFSGANMTFPIAVTFGTLIGVWAASLAAGDARLEGYDDAREMKRHFFGALLMGFGGVTALGCTIGQGISGMATLSIGAPIAMAGVVLGAMFGLRVLISGSLRDSMSLFFSRD